MAGMYGDTNVAGANPMLSVNNPAAQALAMSPSGAPTSSWARYAQQGAQKTTLLNKMMNAGKEVARGGAAVGRFIGGGVAKGVNTAVMAGKQVGYTAEMEAANASHNPVAFSHANAASQANYKQANKPNAGILNSGTFFKNGQEAQSGKLSTVSKRVGGGMLQVAGDVLPVAKIGKAAKIYKAGEGLVDASKASKIASTAEKGGKALLKTAGKEAGKQAAIGGGSSGAASAGAQLTQNGKVDLKQTAKSVGVGTLVGGVAGGISKVFAAGSKVALDKIKNAPKAAESPGVMSDVMTGKQADKAAVVAHTKINVNQAPNAAEKVGVTTPLRPGIKQVSETNKINVRTPQKMSDQQFHAEFKKLNDSYDKENANLQKQAETKALNAPSTPAAKLANSKLPTVDGYNHSSELVKDHADMLKSIEDGATGGQTTMNIDGQYVRTSEHSQFYRQYYANHGRVPSMAAYKEQALKELQSGKAPFGMSDTYKGLKDRETNPYNPKTDSTPVRITKTSTDTRTQVAARLLDAKYEKALNDLQDRYHNPELSATVAPKKLSSQTLPAEKTTGGTQKLVNGKVVKSTPIETPGISNKTEVTGKTESNRITPQNEPGEVKVSGSALKQEQRAVQQGLVKEFENKATYSTGSHKIEAAAAVKLTHEDPQKALDIAMGKTPGNNALHEVAVRHAVENKAAQEGDVATMQRLASSKQHSVTSEAAQRLGAEGYHSDSSNPIEHMRTVNATRAAAYEKKTGQQLAKTLSKSAREIDSHIVRPTRETWDSFIRGIQC